MFTPIARQTDPTKTIRVAIVDDNADISMSVVELLETSPGIEVVAVYGNAREALEEFDHQEADVVLMDLRMPGMNGIQCAAELKRRYPALAIMMFTAFGDDDESLFESLRLGANGYILKRSSAFVLADAIREVHAGGSPMSPSIARKVVKHFQSASAAKRGEPGDTSDDESQAERSLTAREREVLEMLSRGLRYKEIADQLDLSVTTVRTHLGRIYDKLHVTSRTEAVVKFLKG